MVGCVDLSVKVKPLVVAGVEAAEKEASHKNIGTLQGRKLTIVTDSDELASNTGAESDGGGVAKSRGLFVSAITLPSDDTPAKFEAGIDAEFTLLFKATIREIGDGDAKAAVQALARDIADQVVDFKKGFNSNHASRLVITADKVASDMLSSWSEEEGLNALIEAVMDNLSGYSETDYADFRSRGTVCGDFTLTERHKKRVENFVENAAGNVTSLRKELEGCLKGRA